jgi:hypothetical protein
MTESTSRLSEPTELEVQAGAVILATTPLIDAPKLGHNEWMGLSRAILEAAADARVARSEIGGMMTSNPQKRKRKRHNKALGYRLVPVDPTQKMLDAAREAFFGEEGTDAEIQRIWASMLDASPTR